ncbi:PilZ domain-containing protein [Kordiimonas aestuarii]|uniref:PilZ domain-containing protein n=1 Tax=Kordiimonas aestuarii TaxID=1005925 RepID=UPI0021CE36D9|nr:PilZ domain-containing protein [Kordiimonas aestuarii]
MAQEKLEPLQGSDNRRHRRRSVLWPAKLTVGKHTVSCQIWNLSLGGARVRVDLPLKEGSEIILTVADRGDIPALVAWAQGESLGIRFSVAEEVIRKMFADRLHILGLDDDD